MAKQKKIRTTTNVLGTKINLVMDEKDIAGDYAALAQYFGIAIPSTYSWIDKGTISKEHYPRLVEWSGRSLDWWFDVPFDLPRQSATHLVSEEEPTPYITTWPFRSSRDEFMSLSSDDRARVDGYISGLIDARRKITSKTATSPVHRRTAPAM